MTSNSFLLEEFKIEVTNACPLTCIHCSSEALPIQSNNLSKNKCFSIIGEAALMGVRKITFSGGEPLLWDGISEAVELSSKNGMKVTIYTTGYAVNVGKIFTYLKRSGLSRLVFSLYSFNKERHQIITRKHDSFEATINAIKQAQLLDIAVELHFVALSRNYRDLKGVVGMGKKLGVSMFSILRFVPQGRGALLANDVLGRVQFIELKTMIEELREDKSIQVRTGSPFNFLFLNEHPSCLSGQDRLIVSPDLRIYPCDAFKNIRAEEIVQTDEYSTLEKYTLKDCWDRSPYLKAIRDLIKADYGDECKKCNNIDRCASGCLAQKVLKYGKLIKSPDPSCIK